MKTPHLRLYTADLLAYSRYLTSEQLGDALLAACEMAFSNYTLYEPQTTREKAFFELLMNWKKESKAAHKQRRKIAQKAARARWQKHAF